MPARIEYKASVFHDLHGLDRAVAEQILDEQEAILSKDPTHGKELNPERKGLPKCPAGEYRFIYTQVNNTVLVLRVCLRPLRDRKKPPG